VIASDILVQVHIPKCAGTAIAEWLRMATATGALSGFGSFYSDFIFTDESLWQAGLHDPRLSAVSGHNIRRFRPEIHGRRLHYFTILRAPRPHYLSILRYVQRERAAFKVPPEIGNTSYDVARWLLGRPPGADFRENTQTNHLALYPWCDRTGGRCDPSEFAAWSSADRSAYECERLEVAKSALRSFLVVGTVERLHETLVVLCERSAQHGLNLLPAEQVPRANVTVVPVDDVSWFEVDPLGARAAASWSVDDQLYEYAQQLLDEALTRDGWKYGGT
jgi:hypothetical protein